MEKKILITAVVAFILGFGSYFLFVNSELPKQEENEKNATTTLDLSATSSDFIVTMETKKVYTVEVSPKTLVIFENGKKKDSIVANTGDVFISSLPIDKAGNEFLVLVRHEDLSFDFGRISSISGDLVMLTNGSGIKNIGSGIIISPNKKYAAFQYMNDGGECKKDILLALLDLKEKKFLYPSIERKYQIGTGVWQSEMGAYRFSAENQFQFMDMPRACDNSGDYSAQTYYSWDLTSGKMEVMTF